jgi:hypothetical protein
MFDQMFIERKKSEIKYFLKNGELFSNCGIITTVDTLNFSVIKEIVFERNEKRPL